MASRWDAFLALWKKYQRHFNTTALVFGFAFDLYLANRPDNLANNILLLSYLVICAGCIMLLNVRQSRREELEHPTEPLLLLLILQFCFGGLANNLLILYGKSGTIGGSVLFILLLVALIVGNELLHSRYALLRFNIGVYFTLLLTYVVIAAPTFIFHSIGATEFLLSGAISLGLMALFLTLLYTTVLRGYERDKQIIQVSSIVLGIFAFFNILYFTGLIPPVPLSVKAVGLYHSIERTPSGNYTATFEPPAWFAFWRDTSATFTHVPGETAYCFSAIFAPGELRTPITHVWRYYNPELGEWETRQKVTFSILGGREGGYRGFSLSTTLKEGKWRCDVETSRGQLLSRMVFKVQEGTGAPRLSTATL